MSCISSGPSGFSDTMRLSVTQWLSMVLMYHGAQVDFRNRYRLVVAGIQQLYSTALAG